MFSLIARIGGEIDELSYCKRFFHLYYNRYGHFNHIDFKLQEKMLNLIGTHSVSKSNLIFLNAFHWNVKKTNFQRFINCIEVIRR